jgi:hypothetical protein
MLRPGGPEGNGVVRWGSPTAERGGAAQPLAATTVGEWLRRRLNKPANQKQKARNLAVPGDWIVGSVVEAVRS